MRGEPSIFQVMTGDLSTEDPRCRFGATSAPIPATETYRMVINTLVRNGISVERWIIVNERDHTVTYASTYNGVTGSHYDAARNTHWLSWDHLRPKLEEYQFVPTDTCPIATPVSRLSAVGGVRN